MNFQYIPRFIVLGNDEDYYNNAMRETTFWPPFFANRINVSYVRIHVPSDPTILNSYEYCATERLYLPHLLPDEDALVYVDTDIIFLKPPEELASHLYKFDEKNVFGGVVVESVNIYAGSDVRVMSMYIWIFIQLGRLSLWSRPFITDIASEIYRYIKLYINT